MYVCRPMSNQQCRSVRNGKPLFKYKHITSNIIILRFISSFEKALCLYLLFYITNEWFWSLKLYLLYTQTFMPSNCTKILEVNLAAFIYRLFHEDFSTTVGANTVRAIEHFTMCDSRPHLNCKPSDWGMLVSSARKGWNCTDNICIKRDNDVNVNVDVYGLIYPWVQQTLRFTHLVLGLSLLRTHLFWGEFCAFSAANAIPNFTIFLFRQVSITAGWAEAVWNEKFGRNLTTNIGNRAPDLLILRPWNALSTWPRDHEMHGWQLYLLAIHFLPCIQVEL